MHKRKPVKLRAKLPCSGAFTSSCGSNFRAPAQACHSSRETSLLRRDHLKLRLKLPCSGAIKLRVVAGVTVPSAVAPGRSDPYVRCRARYCLIQSVLVIQQLGFDCGDLRVNHAVTVQLTTASEGQMLYMIGEHFRLC